MPDVLILEAGYDRLEETVEKIFAFFPLKARGKKVLLKPNMVGGYEPERAVTTHPALIRACVNHLRKAGAEVTVGDNPGVMFYGANEKVARACGIMEAAQGCYRNISQDTVEVPLKSKEAAATLVSRAVLETDILISLPRFKTHMQTMISGAIKNSYGILAGGEKARFHRLAPDTDRFSRLVTEIFAIRPPDLAIMDAVTAMEGNGPSSHDLRPVGKILASRDAVAIDSLMVAIMGLKPDEVAMLRAAKEMGLGETDLSRLTIEGQWQPLADFKLPRSFAGGGRVGKIANKIWGSLFSRPTLRIKTNACRRCGICFRQCPAKAIEETANGFRIKRSRCIQCYCCYELCVHDAVEIGSPLERSLKFLLRKREGL